MDNVSVIVATFGDASIWELLARRAVVSASDQSRLANEIIRVHGDTLAKARNEGAQKATSEWLIFLDADDELGYNYIQEMMKAEGDIRRPATIGIVNGEQDDVSVMLPRGNLLERNFIVIGAMVRREQFLRVGGFEEYACLEDWEFFLRLVADGAIIGDAPSAIYRIHVRSDSRNSEQNGHGKVCQEIRAKYLSLKECGIFDFR